MNKNQTYFINGKVYSWNQMMGLRSVNDQQLNQREAEKKRKVEIEEQEDEEYNIEANNQDLEKELELARKNNVQMVIDYKAELDQIFEEAWRTLYDQFYDPEFHGQDMKELRKNQ